MIDYLKLINRTHTMSEKEIADIENGDDLVLVTDNEGHNKDYGFPIKLEKQTYEAYKKLSQVLKEKYGIITFVRSGFRNAKAQKLTVEELIKELHGNANEAYKRTAMVGQSEHHTGLAVDINFVLPEEKLIARVMNKVKSKVGIADPSALKKKKDEYYAKMAEIANDYGFILRYPEGKEDVTGFPHESWHLRFVGSAENARNIVEDGGTLDEYITMIERNYASAKAEAEKWFDLKSKDKQNNKMLKNEKNAEY